MRIVPLKKVRIFLPNIGLGSPPNGGLRLITVVDSPCGSGKTFWSIQYINKLPRTSRVLFITPFLSECDRIIAGCSKKRFVQPSVRAGRGKKINNLLDLIVANKNIVSTHALFSSIDRTFIKEFKKHNYILIIDEAMNVLNRINIYSGECQYLEDSGSDKKELSDLNTLIGYGILRQGEGDEVFWENNAPLGKYDFIKKKADTGNLFIMDGNLLMWTFPYEIFNDDVFSSVYILTYQFDYQIHSYYFKYYSIPYEKFEVVGGGNDYKLVPYGSQIADKTFRRAAKELIEICENRKMNSIGSPSLNMDGVVPKTAMSISWYNQNRDKMKLIQNNVTNFWKNMVGATGSEKMWTCFKDHEKSLLNGVLCKKSFIAINARATNDFANKKYLCYLANRYLNPCMVRFFSKRGIHINQDEFALAELVQWIWRSAIRNGEKIYLYIPSERMRNLLKEWLDI